MPLPVDLTTFTLTFGDYTNILGATALATLTGTIKPVDSQGRPVTLRHAATGRAIVPEPVTITIASDGTGSVGPLPHTDNAGLVPAEFLYRVEWNIASSSPSPGNATVAVPAASGSTVDFDLLVPVASAAPVSVVLPAVTSVAGYAGGVTAAQVATGLDADGNRLSDVALRAAFVQLVPAGPVADVQAAVNAVSEAGGGQVHLGEGTFTGPLTAHPGGEAANAILWLPSNVKLVGAGMGLTVIKIADGATAIGGATQLAVVCSTSISSGTVTNVTVTDLTIDGNAGSQTALMHGLRLTRCQGVKVERVEVRDVLGGLATNPDTERFHIEAHQSADVSFVDCVVQATSQAWDTSSGFSGNYSTNLSYVGCLARNLKFGMGFTVFSSSAVVYANCRAYGCLNSTVNNARGFNCEGSEDVHYVNCTSGGRAAESSANPFFTSQQALPNRIGFACSGGRRVDYVGCNSSHNTLDGLWFTANTNFDPNRTSEDVRIIGGQFSDNARYGITLDSLSLISLSPQTVVKNNATADLNGLGFSYDLGRSDLAADVALRLSAAAGRNRDMQFLSDGLLRWMFRVTNDAETGGDTGSNFALLSRTDAGGFKAQIITINRATGDITLNNGVDLTVGTSTGTKIGTSAAEKLGFFGSTPVVRPAAVASPSADVASLKASVDEIRLRLVSLGLITP